MTDTLFDATLEVARELDITKEGYATSGEDGPPITLIDTIDRTEPDDYWNGGTCWLTYDSAGAGAAPTGSFSTIATWDFDLNKATMRIAPHEILSATPASGDGYAFGKRRYPLSRLITAVNYALNDLGDIPISDISTITTAANQTEYDLPQAASTDLRKVYIQTNIPTDTNDYKWMEIHNWKVHKSATGSVDKLITPAQYDAGRLIKIVYVDTHANLRAATDEIDDIVHLDRVVMSATLWALNWYRGKTFSNRRALLDKIERYEKKVAEAEITHPIDYPMRTGDIMITGIGSYTSDFTPGTVSLK